MNRATAIGCVVAFFSTVLAARGLAAGDFNGDGKDDLAVGSPQEEVDGMNLAGAVTVFYGTASGITTALSHLFAERDFGAGFEPVEAALFGSTLAIGDFDGDGFDDLAIGVPRTTVAGKVRAGAVDVLYGSAAGLTVARVQRWTQATKGIADKPEAIGDGVIVGEQFGTALAAGDFDGDGKDDLAIGVLEGSKKRSRTGAVHVLRGSPSGLTAKRSQFWTQNSAGVLGKADQGDDFGAALAAGDWNGDTFDDLVIGVPGEETYPGIHGAIAVLYGSKKGLRAKRNRLIGVLAAGGGDEATSQFGTALAAGDLNGDGKDDVAVGAPADYGAMGKVYAIYGGVHGLAIDDTTQEKTPANDFSPGGVQLFTKYGAAVAIGDFDRDGRDDLAIGAPDRDTASQSGGRVTVLFGSPTGVGGAGANPTQVFSTDVGSIPGGTHTGLEFGAVLAAGDFDGDDVSDLAVGAPHALVSGLSGCGAAYILYGVDGGGLTDTGSQRFDESVPAVPGSPEASDAFGSAIGS